MTAAGDSITAATVKGDSIRVRARAELDAMRAELAEMRAQRDALNDRIRQRVAEAETLASAVALFDRRAAVEADAGRPPRRRHGRASAAEREHAADVLTDADAQRPRRES